MFYQVLLQLQTQGNLFLPKGEARGRSPRAEGPRASSKGFSQGLSIYYNSEGISIFRYIKLKTRGNHFLPKGEAQGRSPKAQGLLLRAYPEGFSWWILPRASPESFSCSYCISFMDFVFLYKQIWIVCIFHCFSLTKRNPVIPLAIKV